MFKFGCSVCRLLVESMINEIGDRAEEKATNFENKTRRSVEAGERCRTTLNRRHFGLQTTFLVVGCEAPRCDRGA